MKIEFIEEQKFTQKWLWVFLVVVGLLPVYGIYKQIFLGEPIGDNPLSNSGLVIISIITLSFVSMFLLIKLKTEIDQEEIRMNFFPFVKKRISWREIKSAKVVNYGFVGGWGIRFGTKYGTVYNIRGTQGLAIELLNGKKFLIGTQKEDELSEVLMKIG